MENLPTSIELEPNQSGGLVWRRGGGVMLRTVARILLGLGIIPYGISKLANVQFQVSAWEYAQPLGGAPGTVLTWAFLGYSPWFQFLLGVLEAIPGLLLLSRRTYRLGALLLLPVLLNVVLMNFAMDLWDGTKGISVQLLVLNLFLLSCDYKLYGSFLWTLLEKPAPIESPRWRIVGSFAAFLIPAVAITGFCFNFQKDVGNLLEPIRDFIGDRQINRAGTWRVEQLEIAGRQSPGIDRLLYFDFRSRCFYTSGLEKRQGRFKADRASHTFEISGIAFDGDMGPVSGTYKVEGDSLTLTGERNGQPLRLVLRREKWGPQFPLPRQASDR